MSGWRDKVKQARLPETIVPIVLRGDLGAEHEKLVEDLEQARERRTGSLAGSGTRPIEARLREIEDQVRDSVVEFRLRALPRSKRPGDDRPTWRDLAEAHPPRVDDGVMDARDRLAGGINRDTFPEPMVRASIIEPDDITDDDWADIMASLTDGQFDQLVNACWSLNRGEVDIPFWSGGSKATETSGPA